MCPMPTIVENLPFLVGDIVSVHGGGGHVVILTKDGKLYSCGWNCDGQLGIDDTENKHQFHQIQFEENVKIEKVHCGWTSSGAITDNGVLYVWGSNKFEQLGYTKDDVLISTVPIVLKLPNDEKVREVSFGLRHTLLLMENNYVYLFGISRCGKMIKDNRDHDEILYINGIEAIKLEYKASIRFIASGENHFIIGLDNNKIRTYGENKFNQCGKRIMEFGKDIADLKSGWTSNACLNTEGTMHLWGRNKYGQLGADEPEDLPVHLQLSQKIKFIHMGAQHGLLVTEEKEQVLTWGWNEHGSCGNSSTLDLLVAIDLNVVILIKIYILADLFPRE